MQVFIQIVAILEQVLTTALKALKRQSILPSLWTRESSQTLLTIAISGEAPLIEDLHHNPLQIFQMTLRMKVTSLRMPCTLHAQEDDLLRRELHGHLDRILPVVASML